MGSPRPAIRTAIGLLVPWTACFLVYVASSGTRLTRLGEHDHYVQLARWFLEGRVSSETPPAQEDAVLHEGRFYVAFPPLPALVLLPVVALTGGARPVLFTAAYGATNVLLMASFLRRGLARLGHPPRSSLVSPLVIAFAFGTAHWYSAAAGTVWHASQVLGLTFLLLAAREALGLGRPLLCGSFLALALAARPPMVFAIPFLWPLLVDRPWRERVSWLARLGVPLAGVILLLFIYNDARFGSPLDFGYTRMDVGARLAPFREEGIFRLGHVPRNAYHALVKPPGFATPFPFLVPDPMGNSLLLLSPFLFGILLRGPRGRWGVATAAAAATVLGLDLCYFSTGMAQFGYRYSLDAMPFLILLAAAGLSGRPRGLVLSLVAASVGIQFLGLTWILNWSRMAAQLFS